MECDPAGRRARKPRVDGVRNRERVLEAAKAVFAAGGPDASLEAVARRAGVGVGTLYRHFPTRQALFEAVYRREVEQLVELAEQLGAAIVMPLDVQQPGQMEAVFDRIREDWGRLDFVVHSIAFAPRADLHGRVVDCSRDGFLQAMAVSCHSFIAMAHLRVVPCC